MDSRHPELGTTRPAVFREPGALLYAGNCKDLLDASIAGRPAL